MKQLSRNTLDAATGRDGAIDVARLGGLVVVMFGHCVLLLATVTTAGVWVGNSLGAAPSLQPLTWFLQVMPLFFLAGGAAGVYAHRPGQTWGVWLTARTQRLCRPLFWYLAFWAAALGVVDAAGGGASAAKVGAECVLPLWFLGVYLIVLAFVPLLMWIRSGWEYAAVVAGLVAVAAVVDWARIGTGVLGYGYPNYLVVWSIPVVIGVAYARQLVPPAVAVVLGLAALAVNAVTVLWGPYDVSLVTTGVDRVSNSAPPTVVLALHCVAMSLLFVAAAGPLRRWIARPWVGRPVAAGTRGAMTLYLWHVPAIAVAAYALHLGRFDAVDPHQHWFWALMAARAAVFAVVMFALFLLFVPLEHRPLPWWDADLTIDGPRAEAAGILVCVAGVAILALSGRGLDDPNGWWDVACFLAAALGARAFAGGARAS